MADIATAIRAVLAADTDVAALVSTRIYPDSLPQGCTLPAIRYTLITDRSDQHQTAGAALAEAVVQVDCYAAKRLDANTLGNKSRLALARYQGTAASVQIRDVAPELGRASYDPPDDASDVGAYLYSRDFRAWYVEDIA